MDTDNDDHKAAIQDALDRAHKAGGLNLEHVDDISRILRDAHDVAEPQISTPAQRGLNYQMHLEEYGQPRYSLDHGYGERPATPAELKEMSEYSRWLGNREPGGSEEARAHSARAVRLAQLAAKPNSKTPVMVP